MISEYVGCGPAAMAAELELVERLKAGIELQQIVHAGRPIEEQLRAHAEMVFAEVERRLIEHGYQKHRGQWRKRRSPSSEPEAS